MVSALVIDDVDESQVVPVPLRGRRRHVPHPAHHPLHRAQPSDRRRRAFAIEVQIPPYELDEPIPKPWKTF